VKSSIKDAARQLEDDLSNGRKHDFSYNPNDQLCKCEHRWWPTDIGNDGGGAMWELKGQSIGKPMFVSLEPIDTLYEFELPRIFTIRDVEGELYLACWSDESTVATRYVMATTTPCIINDLREGRISVWDALNQPRTWICDTDLGGEVTSVYRVAFDSIPVDALPVPTALLLPNMTSSVEGQVIP
jgi:hypothetical protein